MQKGSSTVLKSRRKRITEPVDNIWRTASVESFNNTLKVLNKKKISFEDKTYNMKTALAVGFWNEGKLSSETKFVRNLPGLEASV